MEETPPAAGARHSARHATITTSIVRYFDARPDAVDVLEAFAAGTGPVSCRLMEWVCSTFSRHRPTVLYTDDNGAYSTSPAGACVNVFNVHLEYRARLRGHTKTYFDIFRRKARISYLPPGRAAIDTTVAQMMFVSWAHQKGLVRFVADHRDEILAGGAGTGKAVEDGAGREVTLFLRT